jgi:hypothetical protein
MKDTVEYFNELEPDLWCYSVVQAVSKVLNRMTSHTHSLTNLEMVMYNRLIPTVRIIRAVHYLIKYTLCCLYYILFIMSCQLTLLLYLLILKKKLYFSDM